MTGWRLLLTRPAEESVALASELAAAGIFSSSLPMLEIQPLELTDEQRELIVHLDRYCAVIVVSKPAARLGLELVKLLNGKRDRIALLQALVERMQAFPVVGADGKESIQTSAWWQDHLAGQLESGLQLACKMALLDA